MINVYYNPMRKIAVAVPFIVGSILFAAGGLAQQQTKLRTASLESHEGLMISARPWLDPALYKEKFPKKSPFAAGVLAVQVAFRNDSEESMRVDLGRIRLTIRIDEDNRQELQSLTGGQVADAILRPVAKDPTRQRRFPIPVRTPSGGNDKKWIELQTQAQNAGVPTSIIAPHSTVQGLLYFDLQNQFDLLSTAHLYVPGVQAMTENRSLTYFEIDLGNSSGN